MSGLDTSSLLLEPLMSSDMPWELAWVSFENEVLKKGGLLGPLTARAPAWDAMRDFRECRHCGRLPAGGGGGVTGGAGGREAGVCV